MAGGAVALARIESLATGDVADSDRHAGWIESGANEREQRGDLRRLQRERRHAGAGNTVGDDRRDVLVRDTALEPPSPQVDAIDLFAVRSVTELALRHIDLA